MLKLERVSKYYFSGNNVVQALRRIRLECRIGEFVAITGESGSGKSTLLNVLSGLDTYEEGKLYFNGEDISHYTVEELEHYRKDYIGYVFQEYNIIDSYTVYQNVELALIVQGYPKEQRKQHVLELIQEVGLSHVVNQKASKLSGGEKQRTVIARTLAKEYQILVCDEPTGNLNEEAARGIFSLLREIAKDKLVIVVTHDLDLIQEYATRKVRLYDGEIVEDSLLHASPVQSNQKIEPKESNTTFFGSQKIAWKNILSVPKKSLFSLLTIIFMVAMILFVYSAGVQEVNKSLGAQNPYFENPFDSRIILVNDDLSMFTSDQIAQIQELDNVIGVFENDAVFDTILMTKLYNEVTLWNDFYYFNVLPSMLLSESDLSEGRLPTNNKEVVVADNGVFLVGQKLELANSYLITPIQSIQTDQFEFTVVGLIDVGTKQNDEVLPMYFDVEGLRLIAPSSIYENSQVEIRIEGTEKFDMPSDTWITPDVDETVDIGIRTYMLSFPTWIEIDNSLDDGQLLSFDMMYFDICRDFSYKKEVRDDMEAGLCNATDFIEAHQISFRALTEFTNSETFYPISLISTPYTDDDQSYKLYMNSSTYHNYFDQSYYQITVLAGGPFEGNLVIKELLDLGYSPLYPAQITDTASAFSVVLRNILVILVIGVILFAVFFVGYFVLRNLVFSKLKDYLIIRSIGTSKRTIRRILRSEIVYVAIIAIALVMTIYGFIGIYAPNLPDILRYFRIGDYLLLLVLVFGVLEFMAHQFTKLIFKISVVSALKGVER